MTHPALDSLLATVNRVIVGKEDQVRLLVTALLARGHVLLEDLPGMGKTVLAKTLAQAIGGTYNRLQFTADLLPSDVVGLHVFNQRTSEFELRKGPVFADVLLADEINRATPRTQSGLLECMEERQVTIEGVTLALPSTMLVIATQNPIESEGTYPLPEAQLDRFLFRLSLGYGTREDAKEILRRFRSSSPLETIQPVITVEKIAALQKEVAAVHVSQAVEDYVIDLTEATRSHRSVDVGISPRAMLALLRSAQAYAFVSGRTYVLPDDVKAVFPSLAAHRIRLSMEAELHVTEQEVVMQIMSSVPAPVEESV
ncbi:MULTISPECIES: AAA family ATPase [Brevibacillus]|jgi:MoxR-like ATPase|uniref:Magnesium chelatase n=1 Tax=Brevibacillus parabrevis TaxID=54914 RepID=A0A4Y3PSA6_BREPA|nr:MULTISPECIES: MoxR family ATPase [Brevibacillus]MBU8715708.1 MoxR family ATPase [Brevibacillus parabrevis]MDH6352650.1 MoxR-like ATPase [Brevibacillus sp. 1238]MDR5001711.1 MoxR family ATPase [Brevibacillus parabrevis]MED1722388.1 MoxR family ATPase [Brevibacillus parabrevis]MED2257991.1 MoxR family ATPase [Brevibacillus parabrevis]